jgi:hypothetical protein
MLNPNTSLTRQELFRLVWSKPATHVAKDFGVPPAVVLKACKILNVPRPTTGHWVRVEHGQSPPPPPLPSPAPKMPTSVMLSDLMTRRPRAAKTAPPSEALHSVPQEEPIKWHLVAQKTRAAFRGGTLDHKYGTLQPKPDHPYVWMSVTRGTLDRCLLMLNRLAVLLEATGFSFVMPAKAGERINLVYTATGTELDFFFKEDVERYERELKPEEKGKDPLFIWNRWLYRATGRLRLIISEYHPEGARKSWGDGKNTKLEDKLADAVPDFVICAQGKHAFKLEMEEQHRRWEEEARLRREEESRAQKEKDRRDALFGAAKRWRDADTLQAFRSACEARWRSATADGTLTKPQADWLSWVDEVIRDMNPLTAGFLRQLETVTSSLTGPG